MKSQPAVDVKVRRIKPGKYAADGEYTGTAYTIVRTSGRYVWWKVLVGYGSNKHRLDEHKRWKSDTFRTKAEAVARVAEVETKAKGAQEARQAGLEIEKKVKLLPTTTRMGGFIGGRDWTMLTRLRIKGDPITDWLNGMDHPHHEESEWDALSRMCDGKFEPYVIEGLEKVNGDAFNEDRERPTTPPWTASGGSGISRGRDVKNHWILK